MNLLTGSLSLFTINDQIRNPPDCCRICNLYPDVVRLVLEDWTMDDLCTVLFLQKIECSALELLKMVSFKISLTKPTMCPQFYHLYE